jgi:hypothetical protein
MFSGCIGVADVKEYQVVKYLERKSIVTNYCPLWINLAIIFLHAYVWERMIMKCLLVVLYSYRKVNISWKMNS